MGDFWKLQKHSTKNGNKALMNLESDGNKEAIDAIISNRNLIAHGENSNITLVQLKDYLTKSVRVIEVIENQCGGHV